ncbi:hypothetical protein ADK53_06915 [Streptomyces sp. WM6373]|uniref:hypothetical protein n=1 Tax=unclassified Streptomyces TaxID=2593676 RepID=UPI0006B03F61|nr:MULTISPECIES: hypothetical protein [unclassified Streptomyces]KOU43009.1 hypothetical protein ADK53_06915 [Streptomyces sp. WM6373]KOU84151.1 hypothetical protein ADK93_25970 [Streptomyces sp. XY58]
MTRQATVYCSHMYLPAASTTCSVAVGSSLPPAVLALSQNLSVAAPLTRRQRASSAEPRSKDVARPPTFVDTGAVQFAVAEMSRRASL